MEETDITTIPAAERHRRRLAVSIAPDKMCYALFDPLAPSDEGRLCVTEIPLATGNRRSLPDTSVLEDVVYAHPSLLGDYGRVDVCVDTPTFVLMPSGLDAPAVDAVVRATLEPDDEASVTVETADTLGSASLAVSLDRKLDAFLRRTFNTPRYHHPLALTARCYSVDTASPSPVVNVHFVPDDETIYIVVRRNEQLLSANRFESHAATDTLYYVLTTVKALGLGAAEVRVRTSGHPERRMEATSALQQWFDDVAPASLPSALLREGTVAVALPVELSTLLLL